MASWTHFDARSCDAQSVCHAQAVGVRGSNSVEPALSKIEFTSPSDRNRTPRDVKFTFLRPLFCTILANFAAHSARGTPPYQNCALGPCFGTSEKKVVAQMSKCDFLGPIFHCDSGLCRGLRFCGRKKSPPQKTTPRAEVVPLDPSRSSPPNGGADPTSSKW
jgi:hypothetical protein